MAPWRTLLIAACLAASSAASAAIRIEEKPFLPSPAASKSVVDGWKARFSAETFTAPGGATVAYRFYRPASRARLPVVLILHGSGAIGNDNQSQMGAFAAAWADPSFAATHPAIIVVPQASARTANYKPGPDGMLESTAGASLAPMLALIEHLANDPGVDPARISVVGFSMGASAAMQAVLARPNLFNAVVAFSAVPPARSAAIRMPHIPLLLVHGDADTENPIEPDRAWTAALDNIGADGRLLVYRGMDHRVPDDMLTDGAWRAWLLTQRR